MKRVFLSSSVRETLGFGRRLGQVLRPGQVVAVNGTLGSGKTTLIRGIASALKVEKKEIKSPSYVILHIYKGRIPVYHFDLYRLERPDDLETVGFSEFTRDRKAVCLIEWAEHADKLIPQERIEIKLAHQGGNHRKVTVGAKGKVFDLFLKALFKHERPRD